MGDKIYTIILKVDLSCCRCNTKIKKVLCKYQEQWKIKKIDYDEKEGKVTISGPFCPHKLSKKLRCKAGKVIKDLEIVGLCRCDDPPPPPPPPPPEPKPAPPPPPPAPAPEPPKPAPPPPPAPEPPKPAPPPPPAPEPPKPEPPKPEPPPPPKPEPAPDPPPKPEPPVIPVAYPPIWVPGVVCCGPWHEGHHRPCSCDCGGGGHHRPCSCDCGGGGHHDRGCSCGCGGSRGWPPPPSYGRPCNDPCRIEFFCEEDPNCSII